MDEASDSKWARVTDSLNDHPDDIQALEAIEIRVASIDAHLQSCQPRQLCHWRSVHQNRRMQVTGGIVSGAMNLEHYITERSSVNGDIVNVDTFINHRVDAAIMAEIGRRIAAIAAPLRPDVIVTAEASGIPPALLAASVLELPMVYAKKYVLPGPRHAVSREVASATKGFEYTIEIRRRVLEPGLRALVVDDFLAQGRTAVALGEIIEEAGCEMLGSVFVIEKAWVGGRVLLEERGWPVWSVINIVSVEGGVLRFG